MTSLVKLQSIMARLRTPKDGCPWDLAQNFDTIAPYTIEEAYEVADAIERKDMDDLREELGDLLFQVVFHAQMAEETSAFTLDDVVTGICDKMERRHPHVFGNAEQLNAGAIPGAWERHKERERAEKSIQKTTPDSVLDGIARTLPALQRSQKLQERAARVGFDWPSLQPVFDKLEEEIAELSEAIIAPEHNDHIAEELGDILFVCTNLARKLNVDANAALASSNKKFERRFSWIEKRLAQTGKTPKDASLDEMEAFWVEAKKREREA